MCTIMLVTRFWSSFLCCYICRGVYQDLWDRAEAVYDTIVENPGKTAAVVSLTVIGMLVFVRQRRFLK